MESVEVSACAKPGEEMAATPKSQNSLSAQERLELANQLYREYHARCFWHSPRDLIITEDLIAFVAKGLRNHGGRRGFILSGKLGPPQAPRCSSERDTLECR